MFTGLFFYKPSETNKLPPFAPSPPLNFPSPPLLQGNKMFTGQFFYKPSETVMGDMGIDVRDSDGNVRDVGTS